jgi:ferritin-like protein
MNEQQIDAQALINALTEQRNGALNALAQVQALSAMKDKRIEQLERELLTLKGGNA